MGITGDVKSPYELFGWEVGEGWKPLVEELIKRLKLETSWDGEILQIKEKFGELRFYIRAGSPEIWKIIDEYEEKSRHTCEVCGQPGELRGYLPWISQSTKTLCEEHLNEKLQDYRRRGYDISTGTPTFPKK